MNKAYLVIDLKSFYASVECVERGLDPMKALLEDIYVYSVDEAFIDVTPYLKLYNKTPKEMAIFLMNEVKERVEMGKEEK